MPDHHFGNLAKWIEDNRPVAIECLWNLELANMEDDLQRRQCGRWKSSLKYLIQFLKKSSIICLNKLAQLSKRLVLFMIVKKPVIDETLHLVTASRLKYLETLGLCIILDHFPLSVPVSVSVLANLRYRFRSLPDKENLEIKNNIAWGLDSIKGIH